MSHLNRYRGGRKTATPQEKTVTPNFLLAHVAVHVPYQYGFFTRSPREAEIRLGSSDNQGDRWWGPWIEVISGQPFLHDMQFERLQYRADPETPIYILVRE